MRFVESVHFGRRGGPHVAGGWPSTHGGGQGDDGDVGDGAEVVGDQTLQEEPARLWRGGGQKPGFV